MDSEKWQDILRIGEILLKMGGCDLEAFSGNAIYCSRGMTTMGKLKTVKEVCDLTGLTRKHLYYFHHERIVEASAYANYSVEGYDGYKLYDDAAVEKLQQIALYYQLGLKRNEIREIMEAPDYDSNRTLENLLALSQRKKLHLDREIAALEYLIGMGIRNGVAGVLRGIGLEELGQVLLSLREAPVTEPQCPGWKNGTEHFYAAFSRCLSELSGLQEEALAGPAGGETIQKLVDLTEKHMGSNGRPFLLGFFLSTLGEGILAEEASHAMTQPQIIAVIQYITNHVETNGRKEK